MPATAADLRPERTADGSLTLRSAVLDEQYHSLHGAVQESTHVFIKAGLEFVGRPHVDVLEIGLGTGLNLLLTWIRCLEGKCTVGYTALEPYPLSVGLLEALDHCNELAWPGLQEPFLERMTVPREEPWEVLGGLRFQLLQQQVQDLQLVAVADVIYFDAFGPPTQPDMWTLDVFHRMFKALRPGGVLVTYCAKGEVRRTMQQAGFSVERLPGPPGKREMLRGRKN
ncbi:MAG TPA: tRNA (5-methylaminomethyl-2-thiouridine)(34)-methyltransferase MnmD [Flavobacteriales bacterium]|nr:tRNA (5-methylaminomethyl-2-thiouridine)(34)-methyltransferase MnmD [Flavobacteriales bacterium]